MKRLVTEKALDSESAHLVNDEKLIIKKVLKLDVPMDNAWHGIGANARWVAKQGHQAPCFKRSPPKARVAGL